MFMKKSKRLLSLSLSLSLLLAFSPVEFVGWLFGGIESYAAESVSQSLKTEEKFNELYVDGLFDVNDYKDVISKSLSGNNGYFFYRDGGLLSIKIGQSRSGSGDGVNDTLKDSAVVGSINKLVIKKSDKWDIAGSFSQAFVNSSISNKEKLRDVEYILVEDNQYRPGTISVTIDASVLPSLKYILVDMKYDSSVFVKNFENGTIICNGMRHSLNLTNCSGCDVVCYDDVNDNINSIYNITGNNNNNLRIYTNDVVANYVYKSRSTLSGSNINIYLDNYIVCMKTSTSSSYAPLKLISSYDNGNFFKYG